MLLSELCILKECYPNYVYEAMREGIVEFVTIGLTRERILIDLEKCKHLELKAKDETREAAEKRETYYKNNHKKIYDKVVQLRNELKGQTTIIG